MKSILMIDDDPVVARVYHNPLQAEGYKVSVISDGPSALQMISQVNPDAILIDLMLPGMDGIQVIKQLRTQRETWKVPIIVLTNAYFEKNVMAALDAGANNCLSKADCTPRKLIDMVDKALHRIKVSPAGASASAAAPAVATTASVKPAAATSAPVVPAAPAQPAPAAEVTEAAPSATLHINTVLQEGLRQEFIKDWPKLSADLRQLLIAYTKADAVLRPTHLLAFYQKVRSLTATAGLAGLVHLADMSSALEAFLKELHESPDKNSSSTLRTLALTLDFLSTLAMKSEGKQEKTGGNENILVVDDEIISRKAVTHALQKAKLRSEAFGDPQEALKRLQEQKFDLAVLDINMKGMDGFELCRQLRALPNNSKTPVIFVTGLSEFENRIKSMQIGGNDFIAKPFAVMELGVKALTFIQKAQLGMSPV